MSDTAPEEQRARSAWARVTATLTALAEAGDMDGIGYLELRIGQLERRIAVLEGDEVSVLAEGN